MSKSSTTAFYWNGSASRATIIEDAQLNSAVLDREEDRPKPEFVSTLEKLHGDLSSKSHKASRNVLLIAPQQTTAAWLQSARDAAMKRGLRILEVCTASQAAATFLLRSDRISETVVVCNFAEDGFYVDILQRNSNEEFSVFKSHVDTNLVNLRNISIQALLRQTMAPAELASISGESLEKIAAAMVRGETSLHHVGTAPASTDLAPRQQQQLLQPYFERVVEFVQACIRKSGVQTKNVDKLLLVGDCGNFVKLPKMLQPILPNGQQKVVFQKPGHAIAFGAAKMAMSTNGPVLARSTSRLEFSVVDMTNRAQFKSVCAIECDTSLPSTASFHVMTGSKKQEFILLQLDSVEQDETRSRLAELQIGPIDYPRRGHLFEVEVTQDVTGIVRVVATDEITRREHQFFASKGLDIRSSHC